MRATGPRPEHVIAAAWAEGYLARNHLPVAAVRANGVTIASAAVQVEELRGRFALEPRKLSFVAWLMRPLIKAKDGVVGWFTGPKPKEQLLLRPPSTPWQPENVRDSVRVEVDLVDGRNVAVQVPFVRRDETLSLLALSSALTAAAMIPVPGLGNIFLLPGALFCGARATGAYITGNVSGGTAALLTGAKLVGLGAVDCIPFVANATFAATLLRAQDASERFRLGDGLIDTRKAEGELRALVPPTLAIECAGNESLALSLPSSRLAISSGC